MRSNKSMCIDIGIMPREIASNEIVYGGVVRIGNRSEPYTHSNITWITHPWDKRKTYAQFNVQSSDEPRILRLCNKWGWKIVNLIHEIGQNSSTEINLTNSDIEHNFERTNEIVKDWDINGR